MLWMPIAVPGVLCSGGGSASAFLRRGDGALEGVVYVASGRHHAVARGRPWLYRTEVGRVDPPTLEPGAVVQVLNAHGTYLATAFYHPTSVLAARILTHDPQEAIDEAFFRRRIAAAWELRRRLLDDPSTCRVVFAEADGLPGLVVDRFGDVLVVQLTSAGVDRRRQLIAAILQEVLGPLPVVERDAGPIRRREGLPERSGPLRGEPPAEVWIREGDLELGVDLWQGQKTGHFLDQRYNRLRFGAYCRRLLYRPQGPRFRCLDVFCHTGGFGLQALAAGAGEVLFVDSAQPALRQLTANAVRNGLTGYQLLEANAFDVLRSLCAAGEVFDAVVLDPPAFARTKSQLEGAWRGYKEINLRALRLVRRGGLLVTSSCSQPLSLDLFLALVQEAAGDVGRRVRLLEVGAGPPDHPTLLAGEGGPYLKCLFLQAVD